MNRSGDRQETSEACVTIDTTMDDLSLEYIWHMIRPSMFVSFFYQHQTHSRTEYAAVQEPHQSDP